VHLGPFEPSAADLAPGDLRVLDTDWSEFTLDAVSSADGPLFDEAYARLLREFGPRGEMERREVIADRLAWDPRAIVGGYALQYELLVVRRGTELVAIRDHTAIVRRDSAARAVVHLSHALVEPPLRGSGLAAWLRALPLRTARACAAAAGVPPPEGTTLVAEMEHGDQEAPAVKTRLRSYGKAGFRMVDPARTRYLQPDFRSAAEIDRTSVQPLALALVLRRVGLESETQAPGAELRELVEALHAMFGVHVRSDHMAPLRALVDQFVSPSEAIALVSPWPTTESLQETPR
jgi:GNAT superfamily N-acetyltransferase